ncbi:hypothetical protein FOYG_03832 [Fusarium oxysporum NRRL 32931]|uniref:Secreted protein n=1 Tax=Fusarium oxysporum NRRL 32931 TaxID=660029 RepID=W9IY72_FUSOX|nr:hypothetical protein FOYG_03832 [Fusarium oxysporum NRRL 32931]
MIQWARWLSWLKLQIFCFSPPGASHTPNTATREELRVALLEAATAGSLRDAAASSNEERGAPYGMKAS